MKVNANMRNTVIGCMYFMMDIHPEDEKFKSILSRVLSDKDLNTVDLREIATVLRVASMTERFDVIAQYFEDAYFNG